MTLRLRGVTVRHRSITALESVDLDVAGGERVALVGPSGAGKTSLVDVCAGLLRPGAGEVEILETRLDHGIAGLSRAQRRTHGRRVGIIAQGESMVGPIAVVHNVNAGLLGEWGSLRSLASLVRPAGRAEAMAALDTVGLADRIDDRTADLSGGERQRVAVARVLRQCPDLVLADEPTSSVDPALADRVMSALCERDGRAPWTLLVSVHDPDLARRHVDRVVGLRDGRVAFDVGADQLDDSTIATLYRPATVVR